MIFEYKLSSGKVVRGFFNSYAADLKNNIAGVISIDEQKNGKIRSYDRTVRIDKSGRKFFTWDSEKVWFDNFLCLTPSEFVQKVNGNVGSLYGDDLSRLLLKYGMQAICVYINKGIDEVRYGVDKGVAQENWVRYQFTEDYLHMPIDNYKLRLEPVSEYDKREYSVTDTYTTDLVGLFKACKDLYRLEVA